MPGPPQQLKYEITTSDGAKYEVLANDDAQAQRMADFAETQHKAGNVDPTKWAGIPDGGSVLQEAPGETTSTGGAAARGFKSGFYMNLDDEIAAFGNALVPGLASLDNTLGTGKHQQSFMGNAKGFWAAYENNMRAAAEQKAADEAQHYTAHAVGNVGGAVAGAAAAGGGLRALGGVAARVAPRVAIPIAARYGAAALVAPIKTGVATGIASGAGYGGVSGFGAGDTLANREKSAAIGALAGGTLGGATNGAVVGFGPAVARYARMLLGKGTQQEATAQIVKALARDKFDVYSPAGIQALRTELGRYTGKPVSIADIGAATRARVGVGLRSPSAVQQQSIDAVTSRAQGAGPRLAGDIRATVAPRTDVHALDQALVDQRAQTALPLREQALFQPTQAALPPPRQGSAIEAPEAPNAGLLRSLGQEPVPTYQHTTVPIGEAPDIGRISRTVNDPVLQNLARLPDAQKALQGALQRAEAERALKVTMGQPIDDIPDLHPGAELDMRTFDHLKRFLDDEVNALYKRGDTQTFKAGQANQVRDLRNAIRDRLRNVQEDGTVGDTTGPYGDYLDAYSGPSQLRDDLAAGRDYGNLDPEQIAAEQAGRSTAGKELYRVGAARSLLDTVKATTDGQANPASRILNSDEARSQLAATGVEPSAMQKLQLAIQQERTMGLLHGELKGSQTAARQAAAEDAHAIGSPLPNNPLNPGNWIGAAARGIVNRLGPAHVASVNEALLPRMLETDPQAIDNIITSLEASGKTAQAAALRKQATSNKIARTLGAVIGSPVSLQEDN